ncbi:NEL-type E3 ubiquitin ligase domain-containing protein [Pseudomonas sp. CP4]|uniref:NEL-type E3 ubiquitin ligase domain-containing protein n=1 Tax=Pseudomonas sp. CP4 TaxID=3388844 RepID=UPI0039EE8E11
MPLSPVPDDNPDQGRHYEFIKSAVSTPFKTATVSRAEALAATPFNIEPWYQTASAKDQQRLAAANLKAWGSQNAVDHLLAKIDLYTFAEPLLKAKIKAVYGIEPDVKTTWLRLYIPAATPWYALDLSAGAVTRTVSLLDAALHNFASTEIAGPDSQYISQPDARGLFDVLPLRHKMSIQQFQTLCRELDLGAQYQKHLEGTLLPAQPLAESLLRYQVLQSQKDALVVAAHMALIRGDIEDDAHKKVLRLATSKFSSPGTQRPVRWYDLSLLDQPMTGIMLLPHGASDAAGARPVIAYVPHDPDHPLKQYDSLKAFGSELLRQLREDRLCPATRQTYRQFFSQFIDQQQRGHFFAELEQRLFVVRYHPPESSTDQRPPWRKDPVESPNLRLAETRLQGDYWQHAYLRKLDKILNDGREIAVSTADTDSQARWAWWDNFKKIVSDIFNVALLIATPFVPGLGELMLAYSAYQLTREVVEGVVDLVQGQQIEAAEHIIGVVSSVIQLAAFGAGAQIGSAFKLKLSPLVEAMKPVKLPDGKASLWHPDLAPYEQNDLQLAASSKPDPHGLHQLGSQTVLPLESKLYSVEKALSHQSANVHRIKHPQRANAYKPILEHNAQGAWRHEAENPLEWHDSALMPRLGHSVERFSATELEQIRASSGTAHDELRAMHDSSSAPPPLLTDSLKRFTARADVGLASADIRAGRPLKPPADWFEPIATSLPGWPGRRAIKVTYEQVEGYSRQYGDPSAGEADTLTISQADLNAGRLPERLNDFLNEGEMRALLKRDVPAIARPQALRDLLAEAVESGRDDIARRFYQAADRPRTRKVRIIRQRFPELPLPLAEKLLSDASPAELQRIGDEHRLPLRLKHQARELDFEASASRAYDGFYRDTPPTPMTERLALSALRNHTDAFGNLRIEVRDGTPAGPLRCELGPDDATTIRRLIRDEHGRYEVLDANNLKLHGADDFYEAILRALPDETLSAVGYRRGQGRPFKLWLMELAQAPANRRTALAEPPIQRAVSIETETLVRGWPRLFRRSTPEERIKDLYPKMSPREVSAFVEALKRKGEPVEAIASLENDRTQLHNELQRWRESYPAGVDANGEPIYGASADFMQKGGRHIEERLIECFDRQGEIFGERSVHPDQGYTLDLSSTIARPELERWWQTLYQRPGMKKYFDRITALNLDRARLSPDPSVLLSHFPNLRQLSARQCDLRELPSVTGLMANLEELDLADNRITLNAEANRQLGRLTRLRTLNLNGNPLDLPPDVSAMNHLARLHLANSRIQTWPEGLFTVDSVAKPRPRSLMLDLRGAPLDTLPTVRAGSDQAFVLSRARFDQTRLSNEDRVRLGEYRTSTGLSFVQDYSPAADDELSYWSRFPKDAPATGMGPSGALSTWRKESWYDLIAEPDSAGFFSVIRKQRESADYRTDAGRRRLTRRVWEMVDAVAVDSKLRETLFKQIVSPEDCGDLGAQLFNSLGMKVLVSKAYTESTSPTMLEDRLVRLARGAARLNRVSDEAAFEYKTQEALNKSDPSIPAPDEVEVHLAYETGLAERLQLPWQTDDMLYRKRSGVTHEKLDAAYATITQGEAGDGLVNGMISLGSDNFWEDHLLKTYPEQYAENNRLYDHQGEQLGELKDAKTEWANPTARTNMHALTRRIQTLAEALGIPADGDLFDDAPLSEERYLELYDGIAYKRRELSRRLTREAMARAGL